MLLQPPRKEEFEFGEPIELDAANSGFTQEEIETLAGPSPDGWEDGSRGLAEWVSQMWRPGRQLPPTIEQVKSEFGYQATPFLTDLISVAELQGTRLDGVIKAQSAQHNFYIMRCGVYINPNDEERFEALKFEVHYKSPGISTYTMLPGPESRKLLELGGKADIGITGSAEFGFPETSIEAARASASVKAELEAKFIVSFHYELKTQVVDAFGFGNPFCKWFMHEGANLRNDVVFYPLVRAPKSMTDFRCEFRAFFKIGCPRWKNAEFFMKPPKTIVVSC
jgi:hypothetical protein